MKLLILFLTTFIVTSVSLQSQFHKCELYTDKVATIAEFDNTFYALLNDTLSVSNDNGANWAIVEGLKNYTVGGFCISKQKILVFAQDSFLLRSYDNGKSWQKSDWYGNVFNVKSFGDTVFVFEEAVDWTSDKVVKMSTDGGDSWEVILRVQDYLKDVLLYDKGMIIYGTWMHRKQREDVEFTKYFSYSESESLRTINDTIFAGGGKQVRKSTDYGLTWAPIKETTSFITNFTIRKGLMFVCTEDSIQVSRDNGKSWESVYVQNVSINSMNFLNDILLFGTNSLGMIRSSDNGLTWKNVGIRNALITNVYAVGNNVGIIKSYWRSSDRGETWYINEKHQDVYMTDVLRKDSVLISRYGWDNIFRSSDAGITWSDTTISDSTFSDSTFSEILSVTVSEHGSNLLMFINPLNTFKSVVYSSTDMGITWVYLGKSAYRIFYTETDGENLYTTRDGLAYKSTTKGLSWKLASSNTRRVYCAGVSVFGLFEDKSTGITKLKKSTDQGITWFTLTNFTSNIIGNVFSSGGYLLCVNVVLGKGQVLEVSSDQGVSWYNIPFEEKNIRCNNITVSANRAYLSTNKGLLYVDLKPLANIWEEEKRHATEQRIAISPNPSSHTINIRNTLGIISGKLKVFSTLGMLVLERDINEGSDIYELNVSNFENGVYFLSMNDDMVNGSFVVTHE